MTKHHKDVNADATFKNERGTFSGPRLGEDAAASAHAEARATLPTGWTLEQIAAVPPDAREPLEVLIRELEGQAIKLRAAEILPADGEPLMVVLLGDQDAAPWIRAAEIAAGRGFALAHDDAEPWGYLTVDGPKDETGTEVEHKGRRHRKAAAE